MERTSHSSTPVKGEAALSSTEKRIYIFEKAPVRRAVLQQMLPTVAGQMVALLYNLADTFFVGLLNAPIQTAAVTVAYPPFLMMTAVSNLFGIGGASAVSHALGRRDMDGARRISAIAFWLSLASAAVFSLLCGYDPIYQLLSGGLMLGAFFMATDYTTSPVTKTGQLIFGLGCGLLTVFIRYFGSYPEGVCYSIMIMNLVVALIDKAVKPSRFGVVKSANKEAAAK